MAAAATHEAKTTVILMSAKGLADKGSTIITKQSPYAVIQALADGSPLGKRKTPVASRQGRNPSFGNFKCEFRFPVLTEGQLAQVKISLFHKSGVLGGRDRELGEALIDLSPLGGGEFIVDAPVSDGGTARVKIILANPIIDKSTRPAPAPLPAPLPAATSAPEAPMGGVAPPPAGSSAPVTWSGAFPPAAAPQASLPGMVPGMHPGHYVPGATSYGGYPPAAPIPTAPVVFAGSGPGSQAPMYPAGYPARAYSPPHGYHAGPHSYIPPTK